MPSSPARSKARWTGPSATCSPRWSTRCSRSKRTEGWTRSTEVLKGNQQLFRFLGRTRERCDRLARLVRQCLPSLAGDRVMFGGCYFAGTGFDPQTEQAFASGVLVRLIQEQDNVSWTEEAMREDARFRHMARTARVVLGLVAGLLLVAILGLIGFRLFSGRAPAANVPKS